jgi:hypothetical protein
MPPPDFDADLALRVALRLALYIGALLALGGAVAHPWPGVLLVVGWGLAVWCLLPALRRAAGQK